MKKNIKFILLTAIVVNFSLGCSKSKTANVSSTQSNNPTNSQSSDTLATSPTQTQKSSNSFLDLLSGFLGAGSTTASNGTTTGTAGGNTNSSSSNLLSSLLGLISGGNSSSTLLGLISGSTGGSTNNILNQILNSTLNSTGQLNDIGNVNLANNPDLLQTLIQGGAVNNNMQLQVPVAMLLTLYKKWKEKKQNSSSSGSTSPVVIAPQPEPEQQPQPEQQPVATNSLAGVYECYLGKPETLDYSVIPAGFEFDHNIHLGGIVEFKVDEDLQVRKGYTILHGNRFDIVGSMNADGAIQLSFSHPGATYFFGNFQYTKENNFMVGRVYEPGNEYIQGQCFAGSKNGKTDL